ncbi:M20 family metallo-hydrolase [Celerinatantimonas diazotrophica]|uniref:Allantoate deiminase n=1 Tax=Celerinatantimonas diazotrophica TaxID=412034 RepID=A0A4V2PR79_9GAMM|nr:M20 family metallo-hydrolase [Celerinatantimonas diazotrophica]TCK57771.1 allantoate deiminase [Celerinatantimonas diazotrophica]CAG9298165.1 N-carbamoyl-L-amino-acid hydrolase [Celerinatantimonas diazotrophica]
MQQVAQQLWQWLEEAAQCSTTQWQQQGVTRLIATAEHRALLNQLKKWMKAAGMTTLIDPAANLIGRYPSASPHAKTLIFGSHQDSVPCGGKYDGILGILLPLALVNYFHQQGKKFKFNIEIIAFSDEEGARFPSALIGSKAIAGIFDGHELETTDAQGITLHQALKNFGCAPAALLQKPPSYARDSLLGFFEVHIEQGPVLEQAGLPVGVVNAITGIERHQLTITGKAGHAGTVPMSLRQDALVGAATVIKLFNQLCQDNPALVGVVGKITNYPNGVNVIPETTELTLELRSPQDAKRLEARAKLYQQIDQELTAQKLSYQLQQSYEQAAVECSKQLTQTLTRAIEQADIPVRELFSGAGHDGLAMHHLTDIAMLFIRTVDGLSHHRDEAIVQQDLISALNVLNNLCKLINQEQQ